MKLELSTEELVGAIKEYLATGWGITEVKEVRFYGPTITPTVEVEVK